MERPISRRAFGGLMTGAVSTAALSVSFPAPAVWAQEGSSLARDLSKNLQGIAGDVIVDDASRAAYADDFGRIVHKIPDAVLIPRDAADLAKLVQYANTKTLNIGIRGMGHSMLGQAQIGRGVLIDMSALDAISILDNDRVEVGAGSTWGPVMAETAAAKRTLPVINDTFLSVGGSLSTAGFGPTTWNKGLMVDNTLELEVVTGSGELLRCSESTNPDLFLAVLSGLGQCAIITRAVMKLVAAPTHVHFTKFLPTMRSALRTISHSWQRRAGSITSISAVARIRLVGLNTTSRAALFTTNRMNQSSMTSERVCTRARSSPRHGHTKNTTGARKLATAASRLLNRPSISRFQPPSSMRS